MTRTRGRRTAWVFDHSARASVTRATSKLNIIPLCACSAMWQCAIHSRWESVIALLGTSLGLVIGLVFGWAIVEALGGEGVGTLAVPAGELVAVAVVAALAGVAAAVAPAWRAARLDVLTAIASH